MKTRETTKPALKKLTLKRQTLRRLTPAELRLAAGGVSKQSYVCTTRQAR